MKEDMELDKLPADVGFRRRCCYRNSCKRPELNSERDKEIKRDKMCDRIMSTICCLAFWCKLCFFLWIKCLTIYCATIIEVVPNKLER